MAAVANGDIKARVGTDEIGVRQFVHHFRVSGLAKLVKLRTVTLTTDDRAGNVGVSQDVAFAGGFDMFASRTMTSLAADIDLGMASL